VFDGLNVEVMHAERSPAQREEIIKRFRSGQIWVLICTDLLSRGLDFKGTSLIDTNIKLMIYILKIQFTWKNIYLIK
jgi:superfamily II DNA/RNA helicase